jgi:hypothetical protein
VNAYHRPHGEGTLYASDGSVHYHGGWQDGKRHGKGEVTWADGDHYKGDFVNDSMHGDGEYHWANDERLHYTGQWGADEMIGLGKLVFKNGTFHEGEFANDKLNGCGVEGNENICILVNQELQEGEIVRRGLWKDGVLVEERPVPISKLPFKAFLNRAGEF